MTSVILSAQHVSKAFHRSWLHTPKSAQEVQAVVDVSLDITRNEHLGILGESGSGKTTLARVLLNLETPTSGSVLFNGKQLEAQSMPEFRRTVQAVFQDPASSFNPRMRVADIIREPLRALAIEGNHDDRIDDLLKQVDLDSQLRSRFPHQLSGGQRQRVALARALAPRPQLLIADEPFSALDVLTRDEIVSLLKRLADENDLTLVVISHDLGVVAQLCSQVAVMKDGRIVESGTVREVFLTPRNSFTAELLQAVPFLLND
jgi:peptide/nickel transport system ATP-binding protein